MPPRSGKSAPAMFFAICGDMLGVPYEFEVGSSMKRPNEFMLFNRDYYVQKFNALQDRREQNYKKQGKTYQKETAPVFEFSDDSVLTIATAFSVMQSRGKQQEYNRNNVAKNLKQQVNKYQKLPGDYGTKFKSWAKKAGTTAMVEDREFDRDGKPYKSFGNGAAMRTSAAGWAFNNFEDAGRFAKDGVYVSHAHDEAMRGGDAVTKAIQLARAGRSKAEIRTFLEATYGYDLSKTTYWYRDYNKNNMVQQSENCRSAVQMALAAFLETDNYLDCMDKVLYMGGDTDTVGAIAGSISGAMFGMPRWLQKQCDNRLDDYMRRACRKFENYLDSVDNEPRIDDVENALARAEAEHFLLAQYNEVPDYIPAEDPDYIDRLANMEATRLFHEERIFHAEHKNASYVKALDLNKKDIIARLKESIKDTEAFQDRCKEMTVCPVEKVALDDFDGEYDPKTNPYGKRVKGAEKMFPDEVPEVRHEMIPAKIMDSSVFKDFFIEEIRNAMPVINKRAEIERQLKSVIKAQSEAAEKDSPLVEGDSIPTEADYDKALDAMIAEGRKYFPDGQVPEQLLGLIADFEMLKQAQREDYPLIRDFGSAKAQLPKDDPDKLTADIHKKLQALSEEMMGKFVNGADEKGLAQLAFVNRLTDTVGQLQKAPIRESDVFEIDRSKLEDFQNNLKDARTRYNSGAYKFIISTIETMKTDGPLPVSGSTKKYDTDVSTLSPKQQHVAKLFAIQVAINSYLEHKSNDGVKANTYHKLAAVEALNQFITQRIMDLKPKPFIYLNKKIPDQVIPHEHLDFFKESDIKKSVQAAYANGVETYQEECVRALTCMERIIQKSDAPHRQALVDMQNKFFREPGPQEAVKAAAKTAQADTLTADKKNQEQIAKAEEKRRKEEEQKIAKAEEQRRKENEKIAKAEEKLRKTEAKQISDLEKQKAILIKKQSQASSDILKYNYAHTGRGVSDLYDILHAKTEEAESRYRTLSASIEKIEIKISKIKKQQEERQSKRNQSEQKENQEGKSQEKSTEGNKSQEKSTKGKQSGFVKK